MNEYQQPRRRAGLLSNPAVLLNVAAPLAAYLVLSRHGVSTVDALAVAAVFPAAGAVATLVRSHVLDPLALLVLAGIAVGLVAGLVFHDGRILLVRESFVTGALGVAFLGSLLTRTPLILVIRRRLSIAGKPGSGGQPGGRNSPAALAGARRASAILGAALLADAGVRVGLSFLLSPGTLMTVSPLVAVVILGPAAAWALRSHTSGGASLPGRSAE